MCKKGKKTAIKAAENRTPLNLLDCVAGLKAKEAYESAEYATLFELLQDRFKIIYTIKELNEQKKRGGENVQI